MSAEALKKEAHRWLSQARSDVAAAGDSAKAGRFEWACFQSQQAAEKAMKACWFHADLDPWGHSVAKLIDALPQHIGCRFSTCRDPARQLDKLYVPTRYPNGLPEMTPTEAYSSGDAEAAITAAEQIIARASDFIRGA